MLADKDTYYTSKDTCEILDYSIRHLYKLVREEKIKSIRVGGQHRFKGEWINNFVERSSKQ